MSTRPTPATPADHEPAVPTAPANATPANHANAASAADAAKASPVAGALDPTGAAAVVGAVSAVPAGGAEEARRHFGARLAFETDVSDVAADLAAGVPGIVVVDTRSAESWAQGHVQGAVHLPTGEIAERADALIPEGVTVVVYCWGPGCNGAQKAALEFAKLGRPVKEMIGGFEYWAREGSPSRPATAPSRTALPTP